MEENYAFGGDLLSLSLGEEWEVVLGMHLPSDSGDYLKKKKNSSIGFLLRSCLNIPVALLLLVPLLSEGEEIRREATSSHTSWQEHGL